MHFMVLTRHIFTLASILSLFALVVLSGFGVTYAVVLSPVLLCGSLSMLIYMIVTPVLDLNRTRNGFGYHWFIFKIWWELVVYFASVAVILVMFSLGVTRPQGEACLNGDGNAHPTHQVCVISHGIWAWELILVVLFSSYFCFLTVRTFEYYVDTPQILTAGVRDFNWRTSSSRSGVRKSAAFAEVYTTSFSDSSRSFLEKKSVAGSTISRPMPFPPTQIPSTFNDLRKMEEAHMHPRSNSRFQEHLN